MTTVGLVRIFDHFVVSDVATVQDWDAEVYTREEIHTVISIGCEIDPEKHCEGVTYLSFPGVKDECSVFLVDIWQSLWSTLSDKFESGTICVHCVYGQSRSVATILALLLLQDPYSFSLAELVSSFRSLKPDISINPSFLAQLVLLQLLLKNPQQSASAAASTLHSIYRLLQYQGNRCTSLANTLQGDVCLERVINCRKCKTTLASDLDLISQTLDPLPLIRPLLDEFWGTWLETEYLIWTRNHGVQLPSDKNNRSKFTSSASGSQPRTGSGSVSSSSLLNSKDALFLCPVAWMRDQVSTTPSTSTVLTCPQCHNAVGFFEPCQLQVLTASQCCCDAFVLQAQHVLLLRKLLPSSASSGSVSTAT